MARPGEDDYRELKDAVEGLGSRINEFGRQVSREGAARPIPERAAPPPEPVVSDAAIRDAARQIRTATSRIEGAFNRGMEPQARAIQAGISKIDDAAQILRDAGRLTENVRSRLESLFERAGRPLPGHLEPAAIQREVTRAVEGATQRIERGQARESGLNRRMDEVDPGGAERRAIERINRQRELEAAKEEGRQRAAQRADAREAERRAIPAGPDLNAEQQDLMRRYLAAGEKERADLRKQLVAQKLVPASDPVGASEREWARGGQSDRALSGRPGFMSQAWQRQLQAAREAPNFRLTPDPRRLALEMARIAGQDPELGAEGLPTRKADRTAEVRRRAQVSEFMRPLAEEAIQGLGEEQQRLLREAGNLYREAREFQSANVARTTGRDYDPQGNVRLQQATTDLLNVSREVRGLAAQAPDRGPRAMYTDRAQQKAADDREQRDREQNERARQSEREAMERERRQAAQPAAPRTTTDDVNRAIGRVNDAARAAEELEREYAEAQRMQRRLTDAQRRLLEKVNTYEEGYSPTGRERRSAEILHERGLVDLSSGRAHRTDLGRGVADPSLIVGDQANHQKYRNQLEQELDDAIHESNRRIARAKERGAQEAETDVERANRENRERNLEAARREREELQRNLAWARMSAGQQAPPQGAPAAAAADIARREALAAAREAARAPLQARQTAGGGGADVLRYIDATLAQQRQEEETPAARLARAREGLTPRATAGGGGRDVLAYLDREMGIAERRVTIGARSKQLAQEEREAVEETLRARRAAAEFRVPEPIRPLPLALPPAGGTAQMPLSDYVAGRRRFIAGPAPTDIERAMEVAREPLQPQLRRAIAPPVGAPALANAAELARRAAYEAEIRTDRAARAFNPALENIRIMGNVVTAAFNRAIPEWQRASEVQITDADLVRKTFANVDAQVENFYRRNINAGRLGEGWVRRGMPDLDIPTPPGGGGGPPFGTPGGLPWEAGPYGQSLYRRIRQQPFLPTQGVAHYVQQQIPNPEDHLPAIANYESAFRRANAVASHSPEQVRAATAEVSRSVQQFGALSQAMRRHGAATTEFLTALGQGRTTVNELGWQVANTAGKFGAWTAASAGVFALLGATQQLGQGAIASASGMNELQRYVTDLDTDRAQSQFRALSREFNLPIADVSEAAAGMSRVFSDQDDALQGARAALMAVRVGDLSVADSTKFLTSIVQGFGLEASDLPTVLDQINAAQNRVNFQVRDGASGIAKAAGNWRAAGGDFSTLLAIMATAQRATGASGEVVGTAFRRSAEFIGRPANQAQLREFGIDPTRGVDAVYRQAFSAVERGDVQGQDITRLATALSSPQLAATIGPTLQNWQLFNRAIRETGAEAARGSAGRELSIMLASISERAKRIGTELQQMGSGLAQGGFLNALGIGLELLTQLLTAANDFLEIWNALPGPVRQSMAMMLQMYGVVRLLRRLNVGESLTGAASEMQPSSARGRLRRFGMEQVGIAVTGSPDRAMLRKVSEAMDAEVQELRDRLEVSSRAIREHAVQVQASARNIERMVQAPVNYDRHVAYVDEEGVPGARKAERYEAEELHAREINAEQARQNDLEREHRRMLEAHSDVESQMADKTRQRTEVMAAGNRNAREGLEIAQRYGQHYIPGQDRPTLTQPVPIELPPQVARNERTRLQRLAAAAAATAAATPGLVGPEAGARPARGGVAEARGVRGIRERLAQIFTSAGSTVRAVDQNVIGEVEAGVRDVGAQAGNLERASAVASQTAEGAVAQSSRVGERMRGVGSVAARAGRGLVGIGASLLSAIGPWGAALTALMFIPDIIGHFQRQAQEKQARIRALARPSLDPETYRRRMQRSYDALGIDEPFAWRQSLQAPGAGGDFRDPEAERRNRERAKADAERARIEEQRYVQARYRELTGDVVTTQDGRPTNPERFQAARNVVAEADRRRAVDLARRQGAPGVPMQFVQDINTSLDQDLNELKDSNDKFGDARALYAKYAYEFNNSMNAARGGPRGQRQARAAWAAASTRLAAMLDPAEAREIFRNESMAQLSGTLQQQALQMEAFGYSQTTMQSAVAAYVAMVEQARGVTDPERLQQLMQAQQAFEQILQASVDEGTRNISRATTPEGASRAFQTALRRVNRPTGDLRRELSTRQDDVREREEALVRARMRAGAAQTRFEQAGGGLGRTLLGGTFAPGAPVSTGDAKRARDEAARDATRAERALRSARADEKSAADAVKKARDKVDDARLALGQAFLDSASMIDARTELANAQANNAADRAANSYQGAVDKERMAREAFQAHAIDRGTYDQARAETINAQREQVGAHIELQRQRDDVRIARMPERRRTGATIGSLQRALAYARQHGADEEKILDLQLQILNQQEQQAEEQKNRNQEILARAQALHALQESRLNPDQQGPEHARNLRREISLARRLHLDEQTIWGLETEYNNTRRQNQEQRQQNLRDQISASAEYRRSLTDDPVALARINEEEAKRIAAAPHADTAEGRRQATRDRGTVNTRHRERIQTGLNRQLETADYLRDIGTYSQQELLDAYERIYRRSAGAGPEFRRQLRMRIGRLKHEIEGSSGDFILDVGNIKLPTVYDVRRAFDPIRQRVRDAHRTAAEMTPLARSGFGGPGEEVGAGATSVQNQVIVYVNDPNAAHQVFTEIDRAMKTTVRAKARSAGRRRTGKH